MKIITRQCLITIIIIFQAGISMSQNIPRRNVYAPSDAEVNSFTGNLFHQRSDLFIPGRGLSMDATFYYNSKLRNENIGYGYGWSFTYSMHYVSGVNADTVTIVTADGRKDVYIKSGGVYVPPVGIFDQLAEYQTGKFKLTTKHKIEYYFENATHKSLTKILEPNGNAITMTYSGIQPTTITDASGRSITLSWSGGLLSTITDANAAPTKTYTYQYDGSNQLIKVTNPLSAFMVYEYGPNKELIIIQDYNDNPTVIHYHGGDAVKRILACGSAQAFSYDSSSRKSYSVIDADKSTSYEYDMLGRVVKMQGNCCGYNVAYGYDSSYNVKDITDANNHTITGVHGSNGNLMTLTDQLGQSMNMTYEPNFNQVENFIDRSNNSTSFVYNGTGNLTDINHPLGITESFGYDATGNLTSFTDGLSNTTGFVPNPNGDITQINYPIGTENFTYNNKGILQTATDANAHTYSFTHDALDRLTQIIDPLSHTSSYVYDANDNLITETDENLHVRNFEYDALNRMNSVVDFTGTTNYEYDGASNLTSLTNANGNSRTFSYNNLNLLTSETDAAGFTNNYEYDGAGNLLSKTDANGNTTTYTYDNANQLLSKTYLGNADHYEYDNNGNLTHCYNNNIDITFGYDPLNRLINKTVTNWSKSVSYSYNNANNRQTMTDPAGTTDYVYDNNNRLTQIINPYTETTSFTYDAGGRLTQQNNHNGTHTDLTYDNANNLLSIENENSSNGILSSYVYTYDNKGNSLSMTDTSGTHNYIYDAVDRLTNVDYANGTSVDYTFDGAGNRLQETTNGNTVNYTYDDADRIQTAGTTPFVFDYNGNMISKTEAGQTTFYEYDAEDHLTKVIRPSGDSVVFAYDPFGQRISKTDTAGNIIYYFHDGPNVLMELNASFNTIARYTSALSYDSWISMHRGGQTYYYHKDALGSITGLTNASQNIASSYEYDVYGNILNSTGNVNNPMMYTGRELIKELNLLYYRSRFYNPTSGTFLSKDKFGGYLDEPISLNKYLYVAANPVNNIDPEGMIWDRVLGFLYGGVENFTIQFLANGGKIECIDKWAVGKSALAGAILPLGIFKYVKLRKIATIRKVKLDNVLKSFGRTPLMKMGDYTLMQYIYKNLNYEIHLLKKIIDRKGLLLAGSILAFKTPTALKAGFSKCANGGNQDDNLPNPNDSSEVNIPILTSYDPNELVPPEGAGIAKWVSVNAVLPYTVLIENDPDSATAPAQQVFIKYPLGPHVDTLSVELGDFGFGDFYVDVPPNLDYYNTIIYSGDSLGVDVAFEGGLKEDSNYVFWSFISLDTATGLPTTNPLLGFLLVNDSITHRGEGFANYTIRPDPSSVTFDVIQPQLSIVFDSNNPILTSSNIFNTIDADKPASVMSQNVVAPDSNHIQVSWTGSDIGSGVAAYDIYVAKDSSAFVQWLNATTATTGLYPAELGHSYCFISVAIDSVTNVEDLDTCDLQLIFTPDLIDTTVSISQAPQTLQPGFVLYQNRPNPFKAGTIIPFEIPGASKIKLVITDLYGRMIKVLADQNFEPGYHELTWDANNNSGYPVMGGAYIYQISVDGKLAAKRMMILR